MRAAGSASAASSAWQSREASLRALEEQLGLAGPAQSEPLPVVSSPGAPPAAVARPRTPGAPAPERARTPPAAGRGGGDAAPPAAAAGRARARDAEPRPGEPPPRLARPLSGGGGGGARPERGGSQGAGPAPGLGERRGSHGQRLAALARSVRAGLENGGSDKLASLGPEELAKLTALLESMEREQAGATGDRCGPQACPCCCLRSKAQNQRACHWPESALQCGKPGRSRGGRRGLRGLVRRCARGAGMPAQVAAVRALSGSDGVGRARRSGQRARHAEQPAAQPRRPPGRSTTPPGP